MPECNLKDNTGLSVRQARPARSTGPPGRSLGSLDVSAVRRLGIAVALAASLLTAACAAGRHAQTSEERPTLDGTYASIGKIGLRGLALEAPTGPNYPAGSSVAVRLVLVNSSSGSSAKSDTLVGISSPAFSGWAAYPTLAQAQVATGGATTAVPIGPGQRVSWGVPDATGALQLTGSKQPLYPGTTVPVTFRFADAGSVQVAVPIALSGSPASSVLPGPSGSGAA